MDKALEIGQYLTEKEADFDCFSSIFESEISEKSMKNEKIVRFIVKYKNMV